MMDIAKISVFAQGKLHVRELFLFCVSNRAMVVCPSTGTTLAMERSEADHFIRHALPEPLAFLLVQRGMAEYEGSRKVSFQQDEVCPDFFLIDLTRSCNLHCAYCFRELDFRAERMAEVELEAICDRLIQYSQRTNGRPIHIQPWGGEPLLELPSIIHIRERFDAAGLNPQIVIETNASLINESIALQLLRNRIDIGVSIDGPALVHNRQRPFQDGRPSLDAVEKGIENLRKVGYNRFGSITVVTRDTYAYLPEVVNYLTRTLRLTSIKLNLMRKTSGNGGMAIDLSQIGDYVEKLLVCMKGCWEEGIAVVEQNLSQRIANLLYRPCDNICNAHGCHGGYRMLSIDSRGNVFPCELTDDPGYKLGSIHDSDASFEGMIRRAIRGHHTYFQTRDTESCGDCPWWFYCRGGCRAAAKYGGGNSMAIDRTECAFNKALYPRLVEILLSDPAFTEYLLKGALR